MKVPLKSKRELLKQARSEDGQRLSMLEVLVDIRNALYTISDDIRSFEITTLEKRNRDREKLRRITRKKNGTKLGRKLGTKYVKKDKKKFKCVGIT